MINVLSKSVIGRTIKEGLLPLAEQTLEELLKVIWIQLKFPFGKKKLPYLKLIPDFGRKWVHKFAKAKFLSIISA